MALFDRLLRTKRTRHDVDASCKHGEFVPMWESVDDMGRSDRISRYKCAACGVTFAAGQAGAPAARDRSAA